MMKKRPIDLRPLSIPPLEDAVLRSPRGAREVTIIYHGLPGTIAGVGTVKPGDMLTLDEATAWDLVARKGFSAKSEAVTPGVNE